MNLMENQRAAEAIDAAYMDLEFMLMQNIVRHLKDYGQPIDSDAWLLKKLAEIGKLNQENIKLILKSTGLTTQAMEDMLNAAAADAIEEIDPGLKKLAKKGLAGEPGAPKKSNNVKQAMVAVFDRAKDVFNRTNTTMLYKARDAYSRALNDVVNSAKEIATKQSFIDILDKESTTAVMGAKSRQQAMRDCIKRFNNKGIPGFVDKAGREWTPEAYINMAMRSTAKNVADEVQSARCMDADTNLIAIDSHSGARPKCAKDQGKIFSLDNTSGVVIDLNGHSIRFYPWSSSSYGEPDGLLGINCGHHKRPFIPGVNIHRYFPTDDMDANDNLYKETQAQRALEREVRKHKRECMLLDEIGDKEGFGQSAVKLKRAEGKLKQYVDGNDQLHRRTDREQVVGFDKKISGRAVTANKKIQKELAEKARDDKIKREIKDTGMRGKIDLNPEKLDASNYYFDDVHINKERRHKVTREDAERFIKEADISITKWNGRFINYYGPNGAVFVDVENANIRTAFKKEQFDEKTRKMMEVLKKNGKS